MINRKENIVLKVEDMYKGNFFSKRHKLSWRVPFVCDAICNVLNPNSIIDVGCGIGDYVKGFQDRKVDTAHGIEGSVNCLPYLVVPKYYIFIQDLRQKICLNYDGICHVSKYDLAMCFEVLEHIDPECADILVENLIMLSDGILVSAAPPGQEGHYHVNCQEPYYWIDKFKKHGYELNMNIVYQIQEEWEPVRHKKEMRAYYNNLLYFEKEI